MRLSIKEKMNRIIAQQKAMLASGEKYRPLIENRVQRIAVRLMVIFFTVVFICTMISHVSHSITTASVSVTAMTSGALTKRAEAEGTIQAAADKRIPLPEGLKVVEVNAEKGSRVNEGEALLAFDIPSLEEQLKKLEYEIHILIITTLIISKKPRNTGKLRDRDTEFTTDLLHSDRALTRCSFP